jgi:ribonuclease P protein component
LTPARTLRPAQRLGGAAVAAALRDGRRRRGERLRVSARANALGFARIALVVPKRHLPRAVDRNRAKRVIREAFRLHQAELAGLDVVVRLDVPTRERGLAHEEVVAVLHALGHA